MAATQGPAHGVNDAPADAGLVTTTTFVSTTQLTLALSAVNAMPRTAGGKYERIVSAVA